jgi:hypothetical protein
MRKRKSTIPIIVFIAIVAITGVGLVATGHFSNPFGFLTQGDRGPDNFDNRSAGNNFDQNRPAADNSTAPQFAQRGDGGGFDEGGNTISINWSQAGNVVFDLWYIAATTAVVIIVQKVGGFLIQQIRQRGTLVAA